MINYNATVDLNVRLKQVWFDAGESCKQLIWFIGSTKNSLVIDAVCIKTIAFIPCQLRREITGSANCWSDAYFISGD